jgi:hypothetical protein
MSQKNGEAYIMQETDEEWVSPTPATAAIADALAAATDLEKSDLEDIADDIDHKRLEELLAGDSGEETFTIEGCDVTVDSSGDISVDT